MIVKNYVLTSSGRLKPFKREIDKIINQTINFVQKKFLLYNNIEIIVSDKMDNGSRELVVTGFTPNPYTIFIYLDTKHKKFKKIFPTELKRAVLHEYYHAIRQKVFGHDHTLFEAIVSEGLAEYFEAEFSDGKPSFSARSLHNKKQKEIRILLQRAKKEFDRYSYDEWFFGSKTKKIPGWTGYALGYDLIKKYLENHPHQTVFNLHKVRAKSFLKFF